jgi:Arc-like DNA binding domain
MGDRAMRKPTDKVALQVRMPEAMRTSLVKAAKKDRRSLNGEILWRLTQSLAHKDWLTRAHEARERKRIPQITPYYAELKEAIDDLA